MKNRQGKVLVSRNICLVALKLLPGRYNIFLVWVPKRIFCARICYSKSFDYQDYSLPHNKKRFSKLLEIFSKYADDFMHSQIIPRVMGWRSSMVNVPITFQKDVFVTSYSQTQTAHCGTLSKQKVSAVGSAFPPKRRPSARSKKLMFVLAAITYHVPLTACFARFLAGLNVLLFTVHFGFAGSGADEWKLALLQLLEEL